MKYSQLALAGVYIALAACGQNPETTQNTYIASKDIDTPLWQGTWRSADDPKSTLTIDSTSFAFGYDGVETERKSYKLDNECPTAPDLTIKDTIIVTETEGFKLCYAIKTATSDRLVLIYLPQGNALEYGRENAVTVRLPTSR